MLPIHGPINDMNLCKVVQSEDKSMKLTWPTACGSRAGHVRFQVSKKCQAEGQDLNYIVSCVVSEVLKQNKHIKATAMQNSKL